MNQEHELVELVYAAKKDSSAADKLVTQYFPFIKAETAKFIKRMASEGDDELSIAMFAFHEAALSYKKNRGAFLPYAAKAIRFRLIDYSRKEQRHIGIISMEAPAESSDKRTVAESLDTGHDPIGQRVDQACAKEELLHFAQELSDYGLSLTDIADNCPKQERTLTACYRALAHAKANPAIFDFLLKTKKLPISRLASGAQVERKTLERHRKYMMAILLAYTNGFEVIRSHLQQIVPQKGGQLI